jgi:signal transduction histidine kinase
MTEVLENIGNQLARTIERLRAEEARELSREQMRQLYHKLELVREEERTRIAREVHDELGQVLTTLKLEMSLLGKKLDVGDGVRDRIRMMVGLIDSTIETVKKISSELRPPILDVLGLSEAIKWEGNIFQSRTGIKFDFNSSPREIHLDSERATTIFRVFQETLTNVIRHAKANNLSASLVDKDGVLTLTVKDDGIGITPSQISDRQSLGLLGMRERVLIWGGELEIGGVEGQGTSVKIKIKY